MGRFVLPGLAVAIGLAAGCLSSFTANNETAPREGAFAPTVEGIDANAQPMRLRDHKGKVIMLSFWHSSCPPCRAMFEHERQLVERYAGKPFVLLGINTDPSPFQLRQTHEKARLTWPSWWEEPNGPICRVWNVDRFPTIFLIDAENKVRLRQVGAPAEGVLAKKIDELLKEAEAGS